MLKEKLVESRYQDGTYLKENPEWDRADAPWKANHIIRILAQHQVEPTSICDVGCGAGDVLSEMGRYFKSARLVGYDVSPQAAAFWTNHPTITFKVGDFHTLNTERYDLMTMLDVFEHVRDPFTFLERARAHAKRFVFHIPLDLSASSVARRSPLLDTRHKVGHLHFYTKDLALATLRECGYTVIEARYTGAFRRGSMVASIPRRIAYAIDKDWGVRLVGGETLIVLAS